MSADLALSLDPEKLILVGVSGGPDSLALLHFLYSRQHKLLVACFNHNLRPDAESDVEFVSQFAAGLGLPFVTASADVGTYASSNGLSTEEAARELRYRFLFSQARKAGAAAVAVGHTSDDQAETVLMHFLRGSGLAGLKGMPPSVVLPVFDEQIPLVRPLLYWSRAETEAYCQEHHLTPRTDPTNADTQYYRNRLRHELLPLLEGYNPQIRQTLARTAQTLQGDFVLLNGQVDTAWQTAVRSVGPNFVEFDYVVINNLNPALLRHLVRRATFQLKPTLRDVDFEALERASHLRPVDLAGGLKTYLEAGSLFLTDDINMLPRHDWPQIDAPFPIADCGSYQLANGWGLTCQSISAGDLFALACANKDLNVAWLDAAQISGNLHVRAFRRGDRLEPLGMPHQTTKLSDFFINHKISKRLRERWPLVCTGEVIVWVAGLRMAESFKVTPSTRLAFKLAINKEKRQV